jgi:hypothetical protein
VPHNDPAASAKAFEAFLKTFRNHRAEGVDVPMSTYVTHFKAARTWIERSWDDLDAAP